MKKIAKTLAWVIVLCLVVLMCSNCAAYSTDKTSVNKDGHFVEGFKEGYQSIDPICEDHWLKRCPEDGSEPYWSWKNKPEKPKAISQDYLDMMIDSMEVKDYVIPTTHGKDIKVEEGADG